jgi:uncharacterized protein YdeI (YjbR/CyaY-like superfamily)
MPNGDSTNAMMVNKVLQAGAKAGAGDLVTVAISDDSSEREVEVPLELERELAANTAATTALKALSWRGQNISTVSRRSSARCSITAGYRSSDFIADCFSPRDIA